MASAHSRAATGFTLIEAIVALVLISSTGMALFAWINTNIMTLGRIQAIDAENEATRNVLEYMDAVNPMLTPEGSVDLGSFRLRWQSEASAEIRDGANYPYGVSLYQLGLYQTKISVAKSNGQDWFKLELKQVGYKKVRNIVLPF
jgi:general secretion pathway protein I